MQEKTLEEQNNILERRVRKISLSVPTISCSLYDFTDKEIFGVNGETAH